MNRMRNLLLCMIVGFCLSQVATAQKSVADSTMQRIYHEVKTPYKYGLVVVPDNDNKKIDCPTVFRKGKLWYMTYIEFDGRGYETRIAQSTDLLHWTPQGTMMSFSADTTLWDANQKAGYAALQDYTWAALMPGNLTKANTGCRTSVAGKQVTKPDCCPSV
jgi:predicted GH43/DUF377 family glycosyl hydrolase